MAFGLQPRGRGFFVLFAIVVTCVAAAAAESNADSALAPTPVAITIAGAQALPVSAYLEALKLPPAARLDEVTAKEVRVQLQAFLQRAGYELAHVTTRITPSAIEADVDEGKVDRILFLGPLSFLQLQMKRALALPHGVFNRSLFEARVRAAADSLGIADVHWELVCPTPVAHAGPQLPGREVEILGVRLLHPQQPCEVRVRFPSVEGGSLVGIDVRAYYLDGLELGLHYAGNDLIATGDRLSAAVSGGAGMRNHVGSDQLYPYFSRTAMSARYDAPSLFARLRPNLWAQAVLVSRQRPDLNLESYAAFTTDVAFQLELDVRRGLQLLAGSGFEYRKLYGFDVPPDLEAPVEAHVDERKQPFVRVTEQWVLDPQVLRWDRRHTLESELRYYFPFSSDAGFGWFDLRYQYVKELGWHDVWVKSRAHLSWGALTFHDELSVAELVRGLFVDAWVPSGASLLLEFRFSLLRDEIKAGIFHDFALFAAPLRERQTQRGLELANALGPSLHFLIWDLLQLDLYVGFGFRQRHDPNVSFSLILDKAF